MLQHPSAPPPVAPPLPTTNGPAEVEEFDAPDDLEKDARDVWIKQAPFAFRNGTLTRATAFAFERYCRVVVFERNESKSSAVGGPNHRGLLKQLQALEKEFLLAPDGKPMLARAATDAAQQQPDTPASKLSRFRR